MKPSSTRAPILGPSVSDKKVNGRLPQAASSLLVQLPPDELRKFRDSTLQDGNISKSLVQASDVQLLASSIQQRRERDANVFIWQQKLIDADGGFPRDDLKRALTQMSLSSWLQVLQERHLDGRCSYPGCSQKPKRAHLSSRQTLLSQDAPRYRISMRSQSIRRDERDDPGGENGYCSKACWRRGEWISRWVLGGISAQQTEKEKRKAGAHLTSEDVISKVEQGLGREVDEGGRWERQIEEEEWMHIEILEDLEERGEIDRLSDDERLERDGISKLERVSMVGGSPTSIERPDAAEMMPKNDFEQFKTMLDSLTIVERVSDAPNRDLVMNTLEKIISAKQSNPKPKGIVTPVKTNKISETSANRGDRDVVAALSDADSDDLDVLGELSLRSDSEGGDVVSTILHSSRHLQRDTDKEDDDTKSIEMTEEECKRLQEEDDLFALAWQARDEEKAKGNWLDG